MSLPNERSSLRVFNELPQAAIVLLRKHLGMTADYVHWPACYQALANDLEALIRAANALPQIREAIEKIVVVKGEDSGVILLSQESPTQFNEELQVHVYEHEHFSALGDALVALYSLTELKIR